MNLTWIILWIAYFSHVFKLGIVLNENYETIIEFGFRIIWRIMEISEGVIRLDLRPRRITLSSISIILHKILSLIH